MADLLFLENEFLRVGVHPKGAELQILESRKTGMGYLWNGDQKWWGKHSPVLFPIVGTLRDNTYYYNGQAYTLPRHGFARERSFRAEQSVPVAASFTLQDDTETRTVYPFPFELQLYYSINDNRLTVRYTVQNTGNDLLWFSLGAHPAFAVPPFGTPEVLGYGDHFLTFSDSEQLRRFKLDNGLVGETVETILLDRHRLYLKPELFREDALVLKNLTDHSIRLQGDLHPHGIDFEWQDFPFFGIWSVPGAPFVCLEPWCGVSDSVQHNQELTQKEGIQSLPAGESFSREWSVRCF